MSEQLDVLFRQVLVAREFVIVFSPVAAVLIVWKSKEMKAGDEGGEREVFS